VFADAARRRDADQALLGAWLLLALPTLGYLHVPAKFLVPSAPAAALLAARLLGRKDGRLRVAPAAVLLVAGAALGVLIALADGESADAGRRAAREVIAPRVRAGERVWFGGGWGFQWYAMQAGAEMLASTPPFPAGGDVIVTSDVAPGMRVSATVADSISSRVVRSRFGRVLAPGEGAAFYASELGPFPWTWRNGPIENVRVWRARPLDVPR
jgi:hypothetical protein